MDERRVVGQEPRRTICESGKCDVIEEVHLVRLDMTNLQRDVADDREQWRKGLEKLDNTTAKIFEKLDEIRTSRLEEEHERLIETRNKIWTTIGFFITVVSILASIWGAHLYFR